MVARNDITASYPPVTVNNACNEIGFYKIPTDDLEVEARDGHDPEQVETILAEIEGESKKYIDEMLNGVFPPRLEARFRLSMYVALQMTRGWGFRQEVDELNTLMVPHFAEMYITPERVRAELRRSGQPYGSTDVENMLARLTRPGLLRPKLRQGHHVQNMLQLALDSIMPLLWQRTWRLLEFGEPMLLTSDEPVAVFRPEDNTAGIAGIADSRAIWLPLDRQHALAFTLTGAEQVVPSGPTRARQINSIVATQARRWIFHHPDDNPLAGLELGPRMVVVDEVVGVRREGDTIRELHRLVRRPATHEE